MADETPVKPGWKTSEFWLSFVAALVGFAYASGAIAEGSGAERWIGIVAGALATMGYTASRGKAKSGQ